MTSYIILAHPRSGSTLLADLLKANGLGDPKEHLNPDLHSLSRPQQVYEALQVAREASESRAFGSKIMTHWLDHIKRVLDRPSVSDAEIVDRLYGRNLTIVHLYRGDTLATAISLVKAQRSGEWAQTTPQSFPIRQLWADWPEIRDHIARSIAWLETSQRRMMRLVRDADLPTVSVAYESLATSREATLRTIIEQLLGFAVEPEAIVISSPYRQQADDLSEQWRARWQSEHLTASQENSGRIP